jgi:hypothetical protein
VRRCEEHAAGVRLTGPQPDPVGVHRVHARLAAPPHEALAGRQSPPHATAGGAVGGAPAGLEQLF